MGNSYNYLVSFAAAVGGLLFGYEIGVVSQVLGMSAFLEFFGKTEPEPKADFDGNVTSFFLIGCVLGALIISYLADKIGRKFCILVGSLSFTIGGFFQAFAQNLDLFYAGRGVSGFGIGMLSTVVPIFITETAPTELRGRMATIQQLMITIGILIASIINAVIIKTSEGDFMWRSALAAQTIPGIFLLILMIFIPYSPRWLATKDRDSEAIQILARLRGKPVSSGEVQIEYREIKDSVLQERELSKLSQAHIEGTGFSGNFQRSLTQWSDLLGKGIFNRVIIAMCLQFFQQWTGINVIMYYQQTLLENMGFSKESVSIPLTILNNFINFVATFPGMYLIDKLGRRSLLIWGGFGMSASLYLVCLFTTLAKAGTISAYPAVISVYFFILFFASTWGPVVWVYQSEIFPLRVRAKAASLATVTNWSFNAVIAKITPIIIRRIDSYVYLIFGSAGFIMAIFTSVFVPETMGKSLEDMDEVFGSSDENVKLRSNPNKKESTANIEF